MNHFQGRKSIRSGAYTNFELYAVRGTATSLEEPDCSRILCLIHSALTFGNLTNLTPTDSSPYPSLHTTHSAPTPGAGSRPLRGTTSTTRFPSTHPFVTFEKPPAKLSDPNFTTINIGENISPHSHRTRHAMQLATFAHTLPQPRQHAPHGRTSCPTSAPTYKPT